MFIFNLLLALVAGLNLVTISADKPITAVNTQYCHNATQTRLVCAFDFDLLINHEWEQQIQAAPGTRVVIETIYSDGSTNESVQTLVQKTVSLPIVVTSKPASQVGESPKP